MRVKACIVGQGTFGPLTLELRKFLEEEWHFEITRSIAEADVVFFGGGGDINPRLYGQSRLFQVRNVDDERDEREMFAYKLAFDKLKVGICRGAQLLNIMNGGRLYQHVEGGHLSSHQVRLHNGRICTTTSSHHQLMIPGDNAEVLATAYSETGSLSICKRRASAISIIEYQKNWVDPEVIRYADTRSLCIQGHPERQLRATGHSFDRFVGPDENKDFRDYCHTLIMEGLAA